MGQAQMNPKEFNATLGLVGTVGLLSALMPGIDKLWQAEPTDPTVQRDVLGATTMFTAISAILVLCAYQAGYRKAAGLGALLLGTAVFYYHVAFQSSPVDDLTGKVRTIQPDAPRV